MSLQKITNFIPKSNVNINSSSINSISKGSLETIDLVKEVIQFTEKLPTHVKNIEDARVFAHKLKNFLVDVISSTGNNPQKNWTELTESYNKLNFEDGKVTLMSSLWLNISTKLSNLTLKHRLGNTKTTFRAADIGCQFLPSSKEGA